MNAAPKTSKGPRRPVSARALLFIIDGPREPWWLPVALIVFGVLILFQNEGVLSWSVGTALGVAGAWWTWSRLWVFRYYKALGATTDFSRCVRCGYPLDGLESPVCPECGTDSRRLAAAAKRATSAE